MARRCTGGATVTAPPTSIEASAPANREPDLVPYGLR